MGIDEKNSPIGVVTRRALRGSNDDRGTVNDARS